MDKHTLLFFECFRASPAQSVNTIMVRQSKPTGKQMPKGTILRGLLCRLPSRSSQILAGLSFCHVKAPGPAQGLIWLQLGASRMAALCPGLNLQDISSLKDVPDIEMKKIRKKMTRGTHIPNLACESLEIIFSMPKKYQSCNAICRLLSCLKK